VELSKKELEKMYGEGSVGRFSEGLAVVKKGLYCIYIKEDGTPAFGGQEFETARPFKNGIALVSKSGRGDVGYRHISIRDGKPIYSERFLTAPI